MPIITITCTGEYFPPDEKPGRHYPLKDMPKRRILHFAQQLPMMIVDRRHRLYLDEFTEPEAVQVDIQKFHAGAVNVPEIWVRVEFTEILENEEQRHSARDSLLAMIEGFLKHSEMNVSWALDVFWGPSHGAIYDQTVIRLISW